MEAVLLMNTGAEAVETAIKTARKWGYEVKGVAPDRAKIIACRRNFHGRTVTLVSFSTDPLAHDHYGPTPPGSRSSTSATPTPCGRRSTRTPSPSWSSPSRARPG